MDQLPRQQIHGPNGMRYILIDQYKCMDAFCGIQHEAMVERQPQGKNVLRMAPSKQHFRYEVKVSSKPTTQPIYHIPVECICVDNDYFFLCQNTGGFFYKTIYPNGLEYSFKFFLHVYEKGNRKFAFYDDRGNSYSIAYADQLGHYLWQEKLIFQGKELSL